jgi:hypothetical protein
MPMVSSGLNVGKYFTNVWCISCTAGKFIAINMEEKNKINLLDKLIEVGELAELLGYTDERSIEKWCKKNTVPLFHIGKKIYTIRNFIDRFISEKLELFVKATYKNSDGILKAIYEDDKGELSKLLDAPLDKKEADKFKVKKNSKAADDFMTKLKAA